jgi:hypothetical protein
MVDERQHRRHGGRDPHGRPREAKRRFAPGLGRRVLRFVPIAAVLLVLAWQVFAGMIADTAADSQPEEALAWRPVQPQALLALAGKRLNASPADIAGAADAAAAALSADPLSVPALRVLALAADRAGDAPRALAVMDLAGARTLRDADVETWLFNHYVQAGEPAKAVDHADAVLRAWWPEAGKQMFPALYPLVASPEGRDAIVAALARNPAWRGPFLSQFGAGFANTDAPRDLLMALKQTASPPTGDEIRVYLSRVVQSGRLVAAYLAWRALASPDGPDEARYVSNGDFDRDPDGTPFDWTVYQGAGFKTTFAALSDAGGQSLRLSFGGGRVVARLLGEIVLLPSGTYRLSGAARLVGITNPRGLYWSVRCLAGGPNSLIGASVRFTGTADWRNFETIFAVPPDKCTGQALSLEIDARVAAEQEIAGEAWFDHIAIERAPEGTPVTVPTN